MIGSSKGKLLVFVVFLLGIGTGTLATYEYQTRVRDPRESVDRGQRESRARQDIDKFHDYLGLDAEQRKQVTSILENDRAQFRQFQQKTRPELQALQEATRNKIRAILNDEQKQKYDEYFSKQKRGGRRGN